MIILLQENTSFLRNKLEVTAVLKTQDCNTPAPRISWGKAPDIPKESGKNEVSHLFPNFVSKYRWPNKNWRIIDSPVGILQSLSTQEPPTGWNLPSRIFSFTRSKRDGYNYQFTVRLINWEFQPQEIPPLATCIAVQKCMRIWVLDIDPWGRLVLTMSERPSAVWHGKARDVQCQCDNWMI